MINFVSSKNTDEEHEMPSKSDNIKIMISDKADEVNEELFELFLNKYQLELETSMGGYDFIFILNCCITNVIK